MRACKLQSAACPAASLGRLAARPVQECELPLEVLNRLPSAAQLRIHAFLLFPEPFLPAPNHTAGTQRAMEGGFGSTSCSCPNSPLCTYHTNPSRHAAGHGGVLWLHISRSGARTQPQPGAEAD